MAKYGKGSPITRHRANYQPGIGRAIHAGNDSFSIRAQGYTFNFESNWGDWTTYTKEMKRSVAIAMADELNRLVRSIGVEAIKRCPHYSGALEHSIKAVAPDISSLTTRGRATATIGVLKSWHSGYDSFISSRELPYPTSSPELLRYIHEYYDTFIYKPDEKGKLNPGYKRKLRKEQVTGVHVGSHFLTRAFYESDIGRSSAGSFLQKVRTVLYSHGARAEASNVNAIFEQEAAKYDGLGDN